MVSRLIIFSLITNLLYSQSKPKLIHNSNKHFVCYSNNSIFLYQHNGSFKHSFYIDDEIVDDLDPLSAELPFSSRYHFVYSNTNNHKIVSVGGGMVYEVVHDTLERIDYSFNHKMTHGAAVFVKNDTIFKFGGYGFWSSRNFFTYFDDSTNEWEFYPTKSLLIPPPIHNFNYKVINDDFFILNGFTPDLNAGEKNISFNEIWKFNFTDRKWINLGISNLPPFNNEIPIDNALFFAQENSNADLLHIDINNNVFYNVDRANTFSDLRARKETNWHSNDVIEYIKKYL